jgi:hypothetical protein
MRSVGAVSRATSIRSNSGMHLEKTALPWEAVHSKSITYASRITRLVVPDVAPSQLPARCRVHFRTSPSQKATRPSSHLRSSSSNPVPEISEASNRAGWMRVMRGRTRRRNAEGSRRRCPRRQGVHHLLGAAAVLARGSKGAEPPTWGPWTDRVCRATLPLARNIGGWLPADRRESLPKARMSRHCHFLLTLRTFRWCSPFRPSAATG